MNLARYDAVRYGMPQESESLLEMYNNTHASGFGAEVKRRIMIGTNTLSAGYYDAYTKLKKECDTSCKGESRFALTQKPKKYGRKLARWF